jgi:integrase
MSAWTFQDPKQLAKLGAKHCPWSVGWYDPDGRRKSKSIGSRSMAEKHARKIEGQIAAGTYSGSTRATWADFRREYESKIGATLSPGTREVIAAALDAFEEAVHPARVSAVKTATIDGFIAKRKESRGRRPDTKKSAASINKELRHLKAVFRVAHDWGYLAAVPKMRMLKEAEKLPRFITAEHFADIYDHCDAASEPMGLPYPPRDWWRALLTMAYMTGWRIGECLSVRRDDIDLEAGTAITRAKDNKGKRDAVLPLHPVVIEHLSSLGAFSPLMFPWPHSRRKLYDEFHAIQNAAGINLPCDGNHAHTAACHLYGFHDTRRAFATMNAANMTGDALQKLMRHRSYTTTQRYINLAGQVNAAVPALFVPPKLAGKQA